MSALRTVASLSPSLLARKGAARPAMRPQLPPTHVGYQEASVRHFPQASDDLGWNDMGEREAIAFGPGRREPAAAVRMATTAIAARPAARPQNRAVAGQPTRGRIAFTLRLDCEQHLRLRFACALQNRSAQQIVSKALDRLLDELPCLDELARLARQR